LTVVSDVVDQTFRFMPLDWDGRIRTDPSSAWAMQRLVDLKDRFDIAFACDADHDRHGIVTRSAGLLPPNHYLSVAFQHRDGSVWTTDKDGIVAALLAAEVTARAARDPGELYGELTREFGEPAYDRVEAPATAEQKRRLAGLAAGDVRCETLAGERVLGIISEAPGNGAPIGGVKISSATGWFAARPSGTEEIYKIYAESFRGRAALDRILVEAQAIVDAALCASG